MMRILHFLEEYTAQKMKFSNKDLFSKCGQMRRNPQESAYLVTFTKEILNGKLHILCSVKKIKIFLLLLGVLTFL